MGAGGPRRERPLRHRAAVLRPRRGRKCPELHAPDDENRLHIDGVARGPALDPRISINPAANASATGAISRSRRAVAAAALRLATRAVSNYGFGTNSTKKTKRLQSLYPGNATLASGRKYRGTGAHGHANATLARRHRGNATGFLRHRRHANATRLHHRRHPRRHNPDGLGAPTPGDAADGVVVAAPAPQGDFVRTRGVGCAAPEGRADR